ncbi:MAG TPA: hypothetical protein VIY48_07845 [Candidatus Paceibacterota bacterium]
MEALSKRFWDWIDGRAVIRRIVLFVVLWMTWRVTVWSFEFAHDAMIAGRGMEVAAMLAAVTMPFAALQAFVFKWYSDSRVE